MSSLIEEEPFTFTGPMPAGLAERIQKLMSNLDGRNILCLRAIVECIFGKRERQGERGYCWESLSYFPER